MKNCSALPCFDTGTFPCRTPARLTPWPFWPSLASLSPALSPLNHLGLVPPSPGTSRLLPHLQSNTVALPHLALEESVEACLLCSFPWKMGGGALWEGVVSGEGLMREALWALTPTSSPQDGPVSLEQCPTVHAQAASCDQSWCYRVADNLHIPLFIRDIWPFSSLLIQWFTYTVLVYQFIKTAITDYHKSDYLK